MRDESNATESPGDSWWPAARAAGEIIVITLLFAAAGAWPVPDVNETVYLTKARHAADPSWAAGDFFLETPEAHGVFYVLFGPLAAVLPLDQAAWVGRWLGWLALAAGFRRAVTPLLDGGWSRLLAAAIFSLATRWTTAAGEWVIGGCEAKVFAWALVLAALGDVVRGRFAAAVLPLGAATAAHPIVGGWALIATAATGVWRPAGRRASRWEIAMALAGLAVAAWGVLPALGLSAGVDAAGRAAANRTYVVERLSHHLLLRSFSEALVARHVLAVLAWALLQRQVPTTPSRSRLVTFAVAALAISVAGCGISLLETVASAPAIALLRFYWFRLADVAVPLAISVAAAAVLVDDQACLATFPGRPALARGILLALLGADLAAQAPHWPILGRPGLVPRADSKIDAASWADACAWVRDHTPTDACFLTPRNTASFTWRTGRREVVAWKNSPQDARSLLEWRRRMIDCFSADGTLGALDRSTAALGAERLRLVADRYGADHMIVPVDLRTCDELPFERLYANAGFAVYALRSAATEGASSP